MIRTTFLGVLYLLLMAASAFPSMAGEPAKVGKVPDDVREKFKLAAFYEKHVAVKGFPIVSSAKVSDEALLEAAYILQQMLARRDDVWKPLIDMKIRLAVMSPTEQTTDIPEHSDLKPKEYWDKRARGLGATRIRPAVSCGEENLLNLKGDRYAKENILIHEFGHVVHEIGLNKLDPKFDKKLQEVFKKAIDKGLWKNTYAATNHKEYWAEGVQSYFDCNAPADRTQHNEIRTREALEKYDPEFFQILDEAFRQNPYRYVRYDQKKKVKEAPK
jgi:hypothetical protein